MIPERLDVTDRSLASFGGTEVMGPNLVMGVGGNDTVDGSEIQNNHLGYIKPCK